MTAKTEQTIRKAKGMLYKAAKIAKNVIDEDEITLINKYALSPLSPEDVFSFKVTMAANQVDRDHEVFPVKTLEQLSSMFVGKTVVKDHVHKSDNQIARIYQTYLQQDSTSITPAGEIYTQLIAKCYMIKTASNADLIAEINAGIRKEVSLGCQISKAVCSICDTDNAKSYCKHFPGQTYDEKTCFFKLESPKDAYELSFVAIPAQREAGVVKSYGEEAVYLEEKLPTQRAGEAPTDEPQAPQAEQKAGDVVESNPEDPQTAATHEKIDEVVASVKALIAKMDDFFATVARNAKEERSNETADFSDVTALAEQLDEIAAEAKAQLEDMTADETSVDQTPRESRSEEPSSENPEQPANTAAAEEPASDNPSFSGNSSSQEQSQDLSERVEPSKTDDSETMLNSEQDFGQDTDLEKLAHARLRSLDLSINLLSK